MVNIVKKIVPESRYYLKCPYEMTPTRIVVHNTANDAPARNEISYMTNNDYETSFHYAVDDKEIVQGLPENRNGWHASDGNGKGNREGIAIEICYSLSGGDRFIKAEQNAVDLIVDILNRYNWDIDKVTKHQDYTNKYCPHRTLDMGWDRFLNMINEKLSETRARPFIVGTKIYNTEDIYLTETAGYGGGQMLLTKNTESIVKKYHYNKGLYMALGTENTYYDAAWTNNYSKFTTTKPPVEEQKEDNIIEKDDIKSKKNIFSYFLLSLFFIFVTMFVACIFFINNFSSGKNINSNLSANTIKSVKLDKKIEYNEINGKDIFKKDDKTYYVLFYKKDGNKNKYYNYINEYNKRNIKFYFVNMNNKDNEFLYSDNDLNFIISKDRLLKVNDGEYEYYIDGKNNILNEMKKEIDTFIKQENQKK